LSSCRAAAHTLLPFPGVLVLVLRRACARRASRRPAKRQVYVAACVKVSVCCHSSDGERREGEGTGEYGWMEGGGCSRGQRTGMEGRRFAGNPAHTLDENLFIASGLVLPSRPMLIYTCTHPGFTSNARLKEITHLEHGQLSQRTDPQCCIRLLDRSPCSRFLGE